MYTDSINLKRRSGCNKSRRVRKAFSMNSLLGDSLVVACGKYEGTLLHWCSSPFPSTKSLFQGLNKSLRQSIGCQMIRGTAIVLHPVLLQKLGKLSRYKLGSVVTD